MVIHTVLWSRGDFAEEPKRPGKKLSVISLSFWARAFQNNYILWSTRAVYALLLALFVALFISGLAGGVQTISSSGFCPLSSPSCYRGCDPIGASCLSGRFCMNVLTHLCSDPSECIYPFPSTFFMAKDDATATGWKMNLDRRALPQTRAGGSSSHLSPVSSCLRTYPSAHRSRSDLLQ